MKVIQIDRGMALCVIDPPVGSAVPNIAALVADANRLFRCRGNIGDRQFEAASGSFDEIGPGQIGLIYWHFGQHPSHAELHGVLRTFFVLFQETSLTYFEGRRACNEWVYLLNGLHWMFYGALTNREYNYPGRAGRLRERKELVNS